MIGAFLLGPVIALVRRTRRRNAQRRVYGASVPADLLEPVAASLASRAGVRVVRAMRRPNESDVEFTTRMRTERDEALQLFRGEKLIFLATNNKELNRVTKPKRTLAFMSSGAGAGAAMAGVISDALRAARAHVQLFSGVDARSILDVLERVARLPAAL